MVNQPIAALPPVKNVVLVHGAFADGSGWRAVYDDLTARGYRVTIVQNPLTSLADDVAATTRALDRQDGPTILVGHSWGGTVITEAGVHPNVAGLVYVSALCARCRRDDGAAVRGIRADARVRHRDRRGRIRLPRVATSSRRASPPTSATRTPPSCATRRCRSTCRSSRPALTNAAWRDEAQLGGDRHRGQGVRSGHAGSHGEAHRSGHHQGLRQPCGLHDAAEDCGWHDRSGGKGGRPEVQATVAAGRLPASRRQPRPQNLRPRRTSNVHDHHKRRHPDSSTRTGARKPPSPSSSTMAGR